MKLYKFLLKTALTDLFNAKVATNIQSVNAQYLQRADEKKSNKTIYACVML